jgi:beta-N-acetylhexosaminidase
MHTYDAAVFALNAGCDMVLLCNQSVDGGAAVDELIEGLDQARRNAQWRPNGASEQRRLALLPASPALHWDELMTHGAYRHALDLLP